MNINKKYLVEIVREEIQNVIKEADKYWMGSINDKDDFGAPIVDIFIDGKTNQSGAWGIMSPESFRKYGTGLGTGKGQKYQKQPDGKWKKIEGESEKFNEHKEKQTY